jgi:hypothetical protein
MFKAQTGKDGTIHLLFDSDEGPQYVQSRDSGVTFSAPIAVVDVASRKPGLKFTAWDLAVGPDGRVHVAMGNNAWKLKRPTNEWALYYTSLAAGAKEFTLVRNLNRTPSEGFSIAAGPGGAVTASDTTRSSKDVETVVCRLKRGAHFGYDPELNALSAAKEKKSTLGRNQSALSSACQPDMVFRREHAASPKPVSGRANHGSWRIAAAARCGFSLLHSLRSLPSADRAPPGRLRGRAPRGRIRV